MDTFSDKNPRQSCIRIRESLHKADRLYDVNDLATAYMNRGVTYWSTGKYEEALKDYGECIRIRESMHEAGRLYDWQYDLGSAWLNKGILLADGLHDTDGALEIFNHAIGLLEAEEKLSYYANDTLQRLRYQRDRLTGKTDSNPSIQTMLPAMSNEQLQEIIDQIAQQVGEENAGMI